MLYAVTPSVAEKSFYQTERLYGVATNGSATKGSEFMLVTLARLPESECKHHVERY